MADSPREGRGDATLIVECRNVACRQTPSDTRNIDGRREWTTDFVVVTGDEGTSYYEPIDGTEALSCPDCGEQGVVYAY